MVTVRLHLGVILKPHFAGGSMIQRAISFGHEHKNRPTQAQQDHRQVTQSFETCENHRLSVFDRSFYWN